MSSVHGRKGMTLAELLIVMAIMLLAIGMVVPSVRMATRKTRRAICLSNLRLLESIAERYCIEEKVSDNTVIDQAALVNTQYIKEKAKCPEGDVEYGSFKIKDGPVCPNSGTFTDHKLEG